VSIVCLSWVLVVKRLSVSGLWCHSFVALVLWCRLFVCLGYELSNVCLPWVGGVDSLSVQGFFFLGFVVSWSCLSRVSLCTDNSGDDFICSIRNLMFLRIQIVRGSRESETNLVRPC
jgi:hypothetical protein